MEKEKNLKEDDKTECNIVQETKNRDGSLKLRNPHIEGIKNDTLYHLALESGTHDLVEMFGDVKFVCMGGPSKRMEMFAKFIMNEIGYKFPIGATLLDITQESNRYSLYKVGPVLSVSHGIGISSISILLHEMIKLMYYAKAKNPIFFRIGSCGGIGVEIGTVVVSDGAVDGMLNTYYKIPILGKKVRRPAKLDQTLVEELKNLSKPEDRFAIISGKTMCSSDFYEEQGRLDGAFCEYTKADKLKYLQHLYDNGVVNIEMEAIPFAAITHHAGIKAAIVCVTYLNRLNGDQVKISKEHSEFQMRPQKIVARYIKQHLHKVTTV
ncbi:hypothetical protein FQA39_LY13903 [Lamprigera yunnana]|nr:hypothetical protein FQA39_LY13903 [Lamprigera yunnana]